MKSKFTDNAIKLIKKNIICFYYEKSDHYKSQYSSLLKNVNSIVINEIKIKRKN